MNKDKIFTILASISQVCSTVAILFTVLAFNSTLVNFSMLLKISGACCVVSIIVLIIAFATLFRRDRKDV